MNKAAIGSLHQKAIAAFTTITLIFTSAGCAQLPPANIAATGDPLRVDAQVSSSTMWITKPNETFAVGIDTVGRTGYSSGRYNVVEWHAFQGDAPIDDQNFFRITGDMKAAEFVAQYHQSGFIMNRVGIAMIGVGASAMFVGPFVYQALLPQNEDKGSDAGYVALAGFLTLFTAIGFTVYGYLKVRNPHPINDPGKASRSAVRYNRKLFDKPIPISKPTEYEPRTESPLFAR